MACAHREDSDQPAHSPIRPFADAQADLSLRWAHGHFVGFCHEAVHIVSPEQKVMLIQAPSTFIHKLKYANDTDY